MTKPEPQFKIKDHIEDEHKLVSGIIREIDFKTHSYIVSDEQDTKRELIPWEYAQWFGTAPIECEHIRFIIEPPPIGYTVLICNKEPEPYEVL
jgi:hypothetical protein